MRESSSGSGLSQSEHDWAFAKRALARGEDPEDVIQQIAQHRARDKSDPQDYARRTVTKAQAELAHAREQARDDVAAAGPTSEPKNSDQMHLHFLVLASCARNWVYLVIGFTGVHVRRPSIHYLTCVSESFFPSKLLRSEAP
jgi:hypothetical protein